VTVDVMSSFFALLTVTVDVFVVGSLALILAARGSPSARRAVAALRGSLADHGLWLAAAVAVTSTLGSLYLSEMANFTPCKLCWYQRIAMYPLAVILPIAAVKRDPHVLRYAVPIATIGGGISIYHYLMQRFPSWSSSASCDLSAPCTVTWIWEFHFISIPFMALSGFAAIITLLLWARPKKEDAHEHRIARSPEARPLEAHV
jgi:disulfide bond formation protein DsbB